METAPDFAKLDSFNLTRKLISNPFLNLSELKIYLHVRFCTKIAFKNAVFELILTNEVALNAHFVVRCVYARRRSAKSDV
jgi:hypothetical protein